MKKSGLTPRLLYFTSGKFATLSYQLDIAVVTRMKLPRYARVNLPCVCTSIINTCLPMLPWDSRVLDSNTYTCDLTVGSDNEINTVLARRWVCDYGLYPVRENHIVVLGL